MGYDYLSIDWNENVVILTKFSSLAALEVVILTTFSAASDEIFIKMKTFPFQCSFDVYIWYICIPASAPGLVCSFLLMWHWWICHPWLLGKLSLWQLLMQPMMRNLLKCQPFHLGWWLGKRIDWWKGHCELPRAQTNANLSPKFGYQQWCPFVHELPKLVTNISSQFHRLVNTMLAVGSLVKCIPIKVAHTKIDTIWVVYCLPIGIGSIRL